MTSTPAAAVIVGVDGSEGSLRAVDWAAEEARLRGAPLRVVHAFIWPLLGVPLGPAPMAPPEAGLRNEAQRILESAADRARRAAPGVTVSTDLPARVPAAALIEASHGADLVVVGSRGLGGFSGLLLGSVGAQVTAHAACPVVVVRGGDHRRSPGPVPGEVLVGVDGSESSRLAVGFAFAYASRRGLGVAAVHAGRPGRPGGPGVTRPGAGDADLAEAEARLLTEALAGWRERYPDVPVRSAVVAGRPAEVLVRQASGADLLVVGARGRGGFADLLLGSVSQAALYHAPVPVAVVRPGTAPAGSR
ncbi:universal stress protein [Micromonospora sp. HM5-17]|jgi:nucleotide-binding universal stress UspA family protein|uniref:universal stress protein n=1 Tax=Micromonospora sp. HM5-17 TaxID=2487710 RepID=UPI000F4AA27D|nr:universal stress protein [Micromonospora sp. HM5-17]ROT27250.1 universal stress protein [Micromonospora sp. HM5-17]